MDTINYETIRRIRLLRPARKRKETYHDMQHALCISKQATTDNGKVKCKCYDNGKCSFKVACGYSKKGKDELCYH